MKKVIISIVLAVFVAAPVTAGMLTTTSGCFVRSSKRHKRGRTKRGKRRRCRPNQHWDGRRCRHKGKRGKKHYR